MKDRVGEIWSFGNKYTTPHRTIVLVVESDPLEQRHIVVALKSLDWIVWYEEGYGVHMRWEDNPSMTRHA